MYTKYKIYTKTSTGVNKKQEKRNQVCVHVGLHEHEFEYKVRMLEHLWVIWTIKKDT